MTDERGVMAAFVLRPFDRAAASELASWALTAAEVRAWCSRTEAAVPAEVVADWSAPTDVNAFLMVEGDDVVAYGELWVDDDELEVELARLIVAPAHRRRGVGRRLVSGLSELASRYHPQTTLRVLPDNDAALSCYAAAGFERVTAAEEIAWNEGQPVDYVWMVWRGRRDASATGARRPTRLDDLS